MRHEQRIMNIKTYRVCFDICDMVNEKRKKGKAEVHDFPAAAVACAVSWDKYCCSIINTSGKVVKTSFHKTPSLEASLNALGTIGSKRNGCNNYIGACAEPHAARSVLEVNPGIAVKNLVFSYTYRPRTKTMIRYCGNCTKVFNVQNP